MKCIEKQWLRVSMWAAAALTNEAMFTLPVRLLRSLSTLQVRSRNGSIPAVIVLCSSTEARDKLLLKPIRCFLSTLWANVLMKQALRCHALLQSSPVQTSNSHWNENHFFFFSFLNFWAGGGCIISCDRVSLQSSNLVCIQGINTLLRGHHFVWSEHSCSQLERNRFTSSFESVEVTQCRLQAITCWKRDPFNLKVAPRWRRIIQTSHSN